MSRARKTLKLEDVPRYESLLFSIKKAKKDVEKGRYKLKDLALVATLVYTGCRISEALALTAGDIDTKHKTVRIHQLKKKEKAMRVVPIVDDTYWDIITRYMRRIPSKNSKLFDITVRQARNIVYKFTKRYLRRRYRPHAIRHAFAIFILKNTKDLEVVRRLLGHSDYKWLRVYLNYTQEDLREELERAYKQVEVI